jgi:soluble lytic murein transglycosylase
VAAFAEKHAADPWGARAALALGYFDENNNRAEKALGWFDKAAREPLLREYVLYWRAQAERALKRDAGALADLKTLCADFPDGVMGDQTVDAIAVTAMDVGRPEDALAALESDPHAATKASLLFELARAHRMAGQLARAAADYQRLYYGFPLSDEGEAAASILRELARQMRGEFPRATAEQQEARAEILFDARKWREARAEYEKLLAMRGNSAKPPAAERARLRIAETRVQLGGSPKLIEGVRTTDPAVDAERLYALAQAWRPKPLEPRGHEKEMLAALEKLDAKYPASRANEDGWNAKANYFWGQLDRGRAIGEYRKLLEKFPGGRYAQTAEWRIAWFAYLERRPEAASLLEGFVGRYPSSAYVVDALYWLGRGAERQGDAARARSFYAKAEERFPQTYFGRQASARLLAIGREPADTADLPAQIPSPAALSRLDEPVPAAAMGRWTRAQILRTLAFDASAELELRAAYLASASPRLLLEAAQAALDQAHYAAAIGLARFAVPDFEARKMGDIPLYAWKTLFPLPYEGELRRASEQSGVDLALTAGLTRQESSFQADALSRAGAIGLTQVLPKTARRLARQLHVRYSGAKLYDPDYNLKLGVHYLAELLRTQGSPEAALGAFNAGEERVAAWRAERQYDELPEFVESVPFTETREYIQIVLRNAEIYRMVYGGNSPGGSGR